MVYLMIIQQVGEKYNLNLNLYWIIIINILTLMKMYYYLKYLKIEMHNKLDK